MVKQELPIPIQKCLYKVACGNSSFEKLMPKTCNGGPFVILRRIGFDENKLRGIMSKHNISESTNVGRAVVDIFKEAATYFEDLGYSYSLDQLRASDYIWGNQASPHPILRALFHAFVFGENEFCCRDLPQKSNEERLTGHLLSKLYSSLLFSSPFIESIGESMYGQPIKVDFAYHDLSIGNREKVTGSDFGIVLSTRLPDLGNSVSLSMFQAKKLNKTSSIMDSTQLNAQLSFSPEGASYCCFYDVGTNDPFTPAVMKTKKITETSKQSIKSLVVSREEISKSSIPLSLFLVWMIDGKKAGIQVSSLNQAQNFMLYGNLENQRNNEYNYPGPSRVLSISISSSDRFEREQRDLQNLFGTEYTQSGEEE